MTYFKEYHGEVNFNLIEPTRKVSLRSEPFVFDFGQQSSQWPASVAFDSAWCPDWLEKISRFRVGVYEKSAVRIAPDTLVDFLSPLSEHVGRRALGSLQFQIVARGSGASPTFVLTVERDVEYTYGNCPKLLRAADQAARPTKRNRSALVRDALRDSTCGD